MDDDEDEDEDDDDDDEDEDELEREFFDLSEDVLDDWLEDSSPEGIVTTE